MKFQSYGENALLINFGDRIDQKINEQVLRFNNALLKEKIQGIIYTIPAYASLTVVFDSERNTEQEIIQRLEGIRTNELDISQERKFLIPVCYGDEFGPDLEPLSKILELSEDEIVQIHTSAEYRVFMMGFQPGFVYLGTLDQRLHCPRLKVPRHRVWAGSVGLAGAQTGIYPGPAPGGWQLIGRTPLRMFRPEHEDPFLFRTGDKVKFSHIEAEQFKELAAKPPEWEELYE